MQLYLKENGEIMFQSNQLKKIKICDLRLINKAARYKYRIINLIDMILGRISLKILNGTELFKFYKKIIHKDSIGKNNFIFFKMPGELYNDIKGDVTLEIKVNSKAALVTLNDYMNEEHYNLSRGLNLVKVPKNSFEVGENILAYRGKCSVKKLVYEEKTKKEASYFKNYAVFEDYKTPREIAADFLCASMINEPETSPFRGSCYAIYDYDNRCYRMPCWLWSDAPVVSALLELAKATNDNNWKLRYRTGKYANLILTLRKILPDGIFFRIIRYLTLR